MSALQNRGDMQNGFPQLRIGDAIDLHRLFSLVQAWQGEGPHLSRDALNEIITISRRYGLEAAEVLFQFQKTYPVRPFDGEPRDTSFDDAMEDAVVANYDPREQTQRQEPVGNGTGYFQIPPDVNIPDVKQT